MKQISYKHGHRDGLKLKDLLTEKQKQNQSMTTIKLKLNMYRSYKDGTYPLVFQVICRRRKKLIYTGIRLLPDEFDGQREQVCGTERTSSPQKDVARTNAYLKTERTRIAKLFDEMEPFAAGRLRRRIPVMAGRRCEGHGLHLLDYFDNLILKKAGEGRVGLMAAYRSTRNSLARFLAGKDVEVGLVDDSFVQDYCDFLEKSKVCDNTIRYYLRNFRSVYNLALVQGTAPVCPNPFQMVRTSPHRTVKRALDRTQIQAVKELDLSSCPILMFYRDLYLFSFYAQGMSFVDIFFLKRENLSDEVICYRRRKSGQLVRIPMIPQLAEIIARYAAGSNDYVFPLINPASEVDTYTQYRSKLRLFNYHLEGIVSMLGDAIPLTTYTARHTWATLARDCGVPLSAISAGLGHTSENTTAIYLKELDLKALKDACLKVADIIG